MGPCCSDAAVFFFPRGPVLSQYNTLLLTSENGRNLFVMTAEMAVFCKALLMPSFFILGLCAIDTFPFSTYPSLIHPFSTPFIIACMKTVAYFQVERRFFHDNARLEPFFFASSGEGILPFFDIIVTAFCEHVFPFFF